MTSDQGRSGRGEKSGVDLNPILQQLGTRGRYQMLQMALNLYASLLYAVPLMENVFIGYQPDYQCKQVDNVTQLEEYLPDDVTNFTLYDVRYDTCRIDVTVNTSGTSSTHSLPCVAGVNFSMPPDTSFVTEWSLVCEKAGLAQLTQTGVFGGSLLGGALFPTLADRYGRRKVAVGCGLCCLVCATITAWVPTYPLFLVGKITVGFFLMGLVGASFTMYVEVFPQEWRHVASATDSFMWMVACVIMATAAFCLQNVSWRYLSLTHAALFSYSLFLPCFLDESLRWLLATGRLREAETILKKACRMNGKDFEHVRTLLWQHADDSADETGSVSAYREDTVDDDRKVRSQNKVKEAPMDADKMAQDVCGHGEEAADVQCDSLDTCAVRDDGGHCVIVDISNPLQLQTETFSAKFTVLDLFRHRTVFVSFLVVVFVWMSNNTYYFVVLLGSASLSGNRFLNFALMEMETVPVTFISIYLMHRFNRRPLACGFGMLAGSFMLLSVALAALGGGNGVILTMSTVAQYAGIFCLFGAFILMFVYYMEVFPTAMRVIGTGTAGMIIKATDMAAPFLLLWAEQTPWAPGVLVGCLCCLASLSIWLLPETRHRKLPDTIAEIRAWKKKEQKSLCKHN